MRLTTRIKIQLAILAIVTLVSGAVMVFGYINLPAMLFGTGHYAVTVQLPEAAGLYQSGNVTYRGTEVGRVESVTLTDTGIEAMLSLKSGVAIPSDLDAQVHSQSVAGEQYVALLPRNDTAPPLKNGDVIPRDRTSVPPDINNLLDATNRGLEAIPRDNLKTAIDEANIAIGGLGPEISRIVKGSTALAIDARNNLDPLTTLIDQSQPILESQTQTADSIHAWARNLATITRQLQTQNASVAGLIDNGARAADQARALIERLQPTLPVLLANLVSLGRVAVSYQPALEQLLVLVPQGVAAVQGLEMANRDSNNPLAGLYLDFKLNVNLSHPCTTGYLPAQQIRPPTFVDAPDRPGGLYCRIPQDSRNDVRGARNLPCLTVPGKRAPTAKMCESDEQYVPLNDGNNWKGDPNATLSGQGIPQSSPASASVTPPPQAAAPAGSPPPLAPLATAQYDPGTGTYLAPDGHVYTQADLAQQPKEPETWQSMLTPGS